MGDGEWGGGIDGGKYQNHKSAGTKPSRWRRFAAVVVAAVAAVGTFARRIGIGRC